MGIASLSTPDFCERYLTIQDKYDQLVPFVLNNVQHHFNAAVERSGKKKHLIVKARRFGFSTFIQAFQFKQTMERASRFMTMAHDETTTQFLREMARVFYDELREPLPVKRVYNNYGLTTYDNDSRITIKTAGAKSGGRGGTFGGGIHGSEVAYWTDASSIMAGALQAVSPDAWVFLESTANGAQGLFYEEVQKALAGESEFVLHFYPWFTFDEYVLPLQPGETLTYTPEEAVLVEKHGLTPEQINWRRAKMREPEMDTLFPQEYPEDIETAFLVSGGSAFPGVHLARGGPYQTEPARDRQYVAGLDWGQDENYSSLSIIDPVTFEEVYLMRWRHMLYSAIRAEVVKACMQWRVGIIIPEKNSMSDNVESLINDFYTKGYDIAVAPFTMTLPGKHELVTNFKEGYQVSGLRLLDIPYANHEMNIFVKKQTASNLWTYGAQGKGGSDDKAQDDTVIARLLAYHAAMGGGQVTASNALAVLDYRG